MLVRWPLAALLALLAVHSFAYGGGFVADRAGMAQEFGEYDAPSEAAENLVGLVGTLLLAMGAAATLAAYWVARFACPEGAWLAVALALVTGAIGLYWATVGSAWDAGFYGGVGVALGGLAAALLARLRADGLARR